MNEDCKEVKLDCEKDINRIEKDISILFSEVSQMSLRLNTHSLKLDEHIVLASKFTESIDSINKTLNSFRYIVVGAVSFFIITEVGILEFLKALM